MSNFFQRGTNLFRGSRRNDRRLPPPQHTIHSDIRSVSTTEVDEDDDSSFLLIEIDDRNIPEEQNERQNQQQPSRGQSVRRVEEQDDTPRQPQRTERSQNERDTNIDEEERQQPPPPVSNVIVVHDSAHPEAPAPQALQPTPRWNLQIVELEEQSTDRSKREERSKHLQAQSSPSFSSDVSEMTSFYKDSSYEGEHGTIAKPLDVCIPEAVICRKAHRHRATMNKAYTSNWQTSLFVIGDESALTPYECLVRKQVEYFDADSLDVAHQQQQRLKSSKQQKRRYSKGYKSYPSVSRSPIQMSQIGIRCCHCAHIHPEDTSSSAIYFPETTHDIATAAKTLARKHLMKTCPYVSDALRKELKRLSKQSETEPCFQSKYWSSSAKELGVTANSYGTGLSNTPATNTTSQFVEQRRLPKSYYNFRVGDSLSGSTTGVGSSRRKLSRIAASRRRALRPVTMAS